MHDRAGAQLSAIGRLLVRIVILLLVVSYAVPSWFDDADGRRHAWELVGFLHFFLPAWAWAFYAYARRRLLGQTSEPVCGKCGYNLRGFPRENCPACGENLPKVKSE